MAYRSNPFLVRMSEKTSSDQEFVQLFSPKILEKLPAGALTGMHVFRSAPGAGKTTLLRAFTPLALRAFFNVRKSSEHSESIQYLESLGAISDQGPAVLGVALSCAAGYADLPSNEKLQNGLFRALMDCRVVLRTLRSLALFIGTESDQLSGVEVCFRETADENLLYIPKLSNARELAQWAENYEKKVYEQIDAFSFDHIATPQHERFESFIWLQNIEFRYQGKRVAPKTMLMIDDMHRLRKKQRALLIDEITVMRLSLPIWLAERKIVLGSEFLSQGARDGRDFNVIDLDNMWLGVPKQFSNFAQNILDRRMVHHQNSVRSSSFESCLRSELVSSSVEDQIDAGRAIIGQWIESKENSVRYSEWIAEAKKLLEYRTLDSLTELYKLRIITSRDEFSKQMTLELPLAAEEIEEREKSSVGAAAELFMHKELKIPYYFGIEKLCTLATNNVEELLFLAATLYEGLQSMQVLRKAEVIMAPQEQEKLLKAAALKRWQFIPKNHTEGQRAKNLLDSIATFCKEKTYQPNAPYAPGVTGVRLSNSQLSKLGEDSALGIHGTRLTKVLSECSAENLIIPRESSATNGRDGGVVFYLNRTLCAYHDLPLQMGGWQDISVAEMMKWMERPLSGAQLTISEA